MHRCGIKDATALTHLPFDKMVTILADDIFKRIFVQENYRIPIPDGPIDNDARPCIGLDNGLAPNRRQAIIWINADLIHWRIYAALGGMSWQWWYTIISRLLCCRKQCTRFLYMSSVCVTYVNVKRSHKMRGLSFSAFCHIWVYEHATIQHMTIYSYNISLYILWSFLANLLQIGAIVIHKNSLCRLMKCEKIYPVE